MQLRHQEQQRLIKYYLDNIKDEAAEMAKEAYERALMLIRDNEEAVDKVAQFLLKNETMNAKELDELLKDEKKRFNLNPSYPTV